MTDTAAYDRALAKAGELLGKALLLPLAPGEPAIGRASCRERVWTVV